MERPTERRFSTNRKLIEAGPSVDSAEVYIECTVHTLSVVAGNRKLTWRFAGRESTAVVTYIGGNRAAAFHQAAKDIEATRRDDVTPGQLSGATILNVAVVELQGSRPDRDSAVITNMRLHEGRSCARRFEQGAVIGDDWHSRFHRDHLVLIDLENSLHRVMEERRRVHFKTT